MPRSFHPLTIAESAAYLGLVVGSGAAVITQQLGYLVVPLSLSVGLNLWNRQREQNLHRQGAIAAIQRQHRQTNTDIQEVRQQLANQTVQVQQMLSSLYFSASQASSSSQGLSQAELNDLYALRQDLSRLQQDYKELEITVARVVNYLNQVLPPARIEHWERLLERATAELERVELPKSPDVAANKEPALPNLNRPTVEPDPQASVLDVPIAPPSDQPVAPVIPLTPRPPAPPSPDPKPLQVWSCRYNLTGHEGWVSAVAISPDASLLASGSFDKTIRIWDLKTGELIRTLTGHAASVVSLDISPDGQTLVSGSFDRTLKLWHIGSGDLIHTFTGHLDSVRAVIFSPDGAQLASGSFDATVRLWDLDSWQGLEILQGHDGSVRAVAFSPNGQILASSGDDGLIQLWDVGTGKLLHTLMDQSGNATSGSVVAIAISPDGHILASGSNDKTVKLWDLTNYRLLRTLVAHTGTVTSVVMNAAKGTLTSASTDSTIHLWDLATGTLLHTLDEDQGLILAIAVSADGNTLASSSADGSIRIWQCTENAEP